MNIAELMSKLINTSEVRARVIAKIKSACQAKASERTSAQSKRCPDASIRPKFIIRGGPTVIIASLLYWFAVLMASIYSDEVSASEK